MIPFSFKRRLSSLLKLFGVSNVSHVAASTVFLGVLIKEEAVSVPLYFFCDDSATCKKFEYWWFLIIDFDKMRPFK